LNEVHAIGREPAGFACRKLPGLKVDTKCMHIDTCTYTHAHACYREALAKVAVQETAISVALREREEAEQAAQQARAESQALQKACSDLTDRLLQSERELEKLRPCEHALEQANKECIRLQHTCTEVSQRLHKCEQEVDRLRLCEGSSELIKREIITLQSNYASVQDLLRDSEKQCDILRQSCSSLSARGEKCEQACDDLRKSQQECAVLKATCAELSERLNSESLISKYDKACADLRRTEQECVVLKATCAELTAHLSKSEADLKQSDKKYALLNAAYEEVLARLRKTEADLKQCEDKCGALKASQEELLARLRMAEADKRFSDQWGQDSDPESRQSREPPSRSGERYAEADRVLNSAGSITASVEGTERSTGKFEADPKAGDERYAALHAAYQQLSARLRKAEADLKSVKHVPVSTSHSYVCVYVCARAR
jgi:chromosome segregation ATPase